MHAKTFIKVAAAVAVTLSIGVSSCGFANTSSTGPSDPYAAGLFNELNADRAGNNLPPLTWSPKLANQAGTWAAHMSSVGTLYHQNLGALIDSSDYVGYRSLGENILVGPGAMTPDNVESAWMASPPHRANIASPAFNIVGIAYWRGPDGRIWAVQDFGGI